MKQRVSVHSYLAVTDISRSGRHAQGGSQRSSVQYRRHQRRRALRTSSVRGNCSKDRCTGHHTLPVDTSDTGALASDTMTVHYQDYLTLERIRLYTQIYIYTAYWVLAIPKSQDHSCQRLLSPRAEEDAHAASTRHTHTNPAASSRRAASTRTPPPRIKQPIVIYIYIETCSMVKTGAHYFKQATVHHFLLTALSKVVLRKFAFCRASAHRPPARS